MDITVNVVDAFIDSGQGGNPAGVVLDAGGFSAETKQRIAARVGLSETVFVSPSSVADFKLEFFTPTRQIPHCGHATIATFCYLLQRGKITGHYNDLAWFILLSVGGYLRIVCCSALTSQRPFCLTKVSVIRARTVWPLLDV